MNKNLFDRLIVFIEQEGENINSFSKKVRFSSGLLAKLIKKNGSLGSDKLMNIFIEYPNLSPNWLLTGQGNMRLEEEKSIENLSPRKRDCTKPSDVYCPICIEKDKLIKNQSERIAELKETIAILKNCHDILR